MEKYLNLELPKGLNNQAIDDIRKELNNMDEVEKTGLGDARFIDPASIIVWVTLIGLVVDNIDKSVNAVNKIKVLFQKKGIKGVKITRRDGTTISVDETSADEIVKLLNEDE